MYHYHVRNITDDYIVEEHASMKEALQCMKEHLLMEEHENKTFSIEIMETSDCRKHGIIHEREKNCPECVAEAVQDVLQENI